MWTHSINKFQVKMFKAVLCQLSYIDIDFKSFVIVQMQMIL